MRVSICLTFAWLLAAAPVAWAQRITPPPAPDVGSNAGPGSTSEDDASIDCAHAQALKFAPGKTETSVSDALTRDDPQGGCYTFVARKGQTLDATLVDDSTPNTAIMVFRPGYALRKHDDYQYMDGPMLPGAGRDDAAKRLHAVLPVSGRYLIMMGPAYGGAAGYTLRIRIR